MKLKHYHLFLFAALCFALVFIGINNKYDRFYRIPGINNENRILIENYMSEADQNYMIENNINVNHFIRFIRCGGFHIQNYEYYEAVEKSNLFASSQEIVTHTNTIVESLEKNASWSVSERLNQLLDSKLLLDYENNENFNFDHLSVYKELKSYYDNSNYIETIDQYIEDLQSIGYKSVEECREVLNDLYSYYSLSQIDRLVELSKEKKQTVFLRNPDDLLVVLSGEYTIDSYVPENLVLLDDVPRYRYFSYLRQDAYQDLVELCQAYEQSEDYEAYFVYSAYQSYETIQEEDALQAGYKEEQLGLSVTFRVPNKNLEEFDQTSFYKWLNEHGYEYGYVLRYPSDKQDVTNQEGRNYLYRYVGKEVAKAMHDQNITTIEEYKQVLLEHKLG